MHLAEELARAAAWRLECFRKECRLSTQAPCFVPRPATAARQLLNTPPLLHLSRSTAAANLRPSKTHAGFLSRLIEAQMKTTMRWPHLTPARRMPTRVSPCRPTAARRPTVVTRAQPVATVSRLPASRPGLANHGTQASRPSATGWMITIRILRPYLPSQLPRPHYVLTRDAHSLHGLTYVTGYASHHSRSPSPYTPWPSHGAGAERV